MKYNLKFLHVVTIAIGFAVLAAAADSAQAGTGRVALNFSKAGFIVGAAGGGGMLTYKGKNHGLQVRGLSLGLTIGAARADMTGTAEDLSRVSDIEGLYTAAGGSLAAGGGAGGMVLRNSKGVTLRLEGTQAGLEASIASSGVNIKLK